MSSTTPSLASSNNKSIPPSNNANGHAPSPPKTPSIMPIATAAAAAAATNNNNEPTAKVETVMPSLPLINILHRKLRDPSIVSSFERHRARCLTEGLVRPRWVLLKHAEDEDGAVPVDDSSVAGVKSVTADIIDGGAKDDNQKFIASGNVHDCATDGPDATTASTANTNTQSNNDNCPLNNNAPSKNHPKYNTIPKRNYIDLRMEQNKMFAHDQSIQCQQILSKLVLPTNTCNTNTEQWKRRVDTIQSLLNEGLAACPNHEGLLCAEREYKGWIQRRIESLTMGENGMKSAPLSIKAAPATTTNGNNDNKTSTIFPNPYSSHRKGAEGRAQAAMRDALTERSFMLGDAGGKDGGEYPLLSADEVGGLGRGDLLANDAEQGENDGREDGQDGNSLGGSSIDGNSHGRRRSSKHKRKKHKRGRKRDSRDSRKSRERRSSRRSRSDSRSLSRSLSVSSSSLSSSYRSRKHRRKEKKRRSRGNHHRRSRSRRHRSEEDEDDDSLESGRKTEENEAR